MKTKVYRIFKKSGEPGFEEFPILERADYSRLAEKVRNTGLEYNARQVRVQINMAELKTRPDFVEVERTTVRDGRSIISVFTVGGHLYERAAVDFLPGIGSVIHSWAATQAGKDALTRIILN